MARTAAAAVNSQTTEAQTLPDAAPPVPAAFDADTVIAEAVTGAASGSAAMTAAANAAPGAVAPSVSPTRSSRASRRVSRARQTFLDRVLAQVKKRSDLRD